MAPTFALLLTALHCFASSAFGISTSEKGPRALLSDTISSANHLHDEQSLSSILPKKVFASEINFCTLENRACSSKLNTFNPFDVIYDAYEGIDNKSPYNPKFDSVFFTESTLKPGNKIHLTEQQEEFPGHGNLRVSTGFIGHGLEKLLAHSDEVIQSTILKYCNMSSLMGSKTQGCTKSLEQLVEFSKTALGSNHLVALTTKSIKIKDTGKELQIGNVQKIKADKTVTCHGFLLDSATYLCHLIPKRLFLVEVINPETKTPISTVLAICHTDNSGWTKDHVAFKISKSSPGKIDEACHWVIDLDLILFGDY